MKDLLKRVALTAIKAGNEILSFYKDDINFVKKDDDSPLTKADLASNSLIKYELNLK